MTYSCAASSWQLTHVIQSGRPVHGVAVLCNRVYVVRLMTSDIEIYDSSTMTLQRHLPVSKLVQPLDMASSVKHTCLYVADGRDCCVHRVALNGTKQQWSIGEWPDSLSTTPHGHNVVVTCRQARKLKEYTTSGYLIREILLNEDVYQPLHALQLPGEQFVVCHGWGSGPPHRVCIVDVYGRVRQHYRGPSCADGRLDFPSRLAVDEHGFIYVSDVVGQKLLLLSPSLVYVKDLSELLKTGTSARRLCLDVIGGCLVVAQWELDRELDTNVVQIFKHSSSSLESDDDHPTEGEWFDF